MAINAERRLTITFSITLLILAAEVAGGILSNSLALLSDAGHVLTDAFALGLSMLAARISRLPTSRMATFGYQRVGLLAAVVNGLLLVAIAAFVFRESYLRFLSPPGIDLGVMMPVAVGGFLANVLMIFILGRGHEDLNVRSAWLHVLGDTLSSLGVIVSGAIIFLTGWLYADPLAGLFIGAVIITGGVRVVKEAVYIFLDLVPRGYNVMEIARKISGIPRVLGVHDVHVRSLTHKKVSFTAHIWVEDMMLSEADRVKEKVEALLREMGINHTMLQLEAGECKTNGIFCRTCSPREVEAVPHRHS